MSRRASVDRTMAYRPSTNPANASEAPSQSTSPTVAAESVARSRSNRCRCPTWSSGTPSRRDAGRRRTRPTTSTAWPPCWRRSSRPIRARSSGWTTYSRPERKEETEWRRPPWRLSGPGSSAPRSRTTSSSREPQSTSSTGASRARGTTSTSFAWLNANQKTPRAYFDLNLAGMAEHRALAESLRTARWYHPDGNLCWADEDGLPELRARVARLREWGYAGRMDRRPHRQHRPRTERGLS